MKLIHYHLPYLGGVWGAADGDEVRALTTDREAAGAFLSALLQWPDPAGLLRESIGRASADAEPVSLKELLEAPPIPDRPHLLAPLDHQEVWAAGVTYLRSKQARMEESEGAARFYDLVYDAERPELFLKATPSRVAGPGKAVRIREDARWNVPEPELGLLVSPSLKIVGYTVGNDMSSRDIEGENPLYLPQAKVYARCCGLGPVILLEDGDAPEHREFEITLAIQRQGAEVFRGSTSTGQMKRKFADLVSWLGRDNVFPHGAFLLTGTGLVPGDDFTLEPGDRVQIAVPEIGTLSNMVDRGGRPW